jgi:S-DNA-T family DNA segregation ATPase FtsK/SpoIIIE
MSEAKPDVIGLTASIITWGIKQFKDGGIREVITGLGLSNKDKISPTLIKAHKTDTGTDYVFSIPPGMTRNDFEKNRSAFETYLNLSCEIESAGRRLIIKTHKATFPSKVNYHHQASEYLAPVPLGVTPEGNHLTIDLSTLPHALYGGMTGYGKTTALMVATVSLLLSGVEVSIVDRKRVDFPALAPWVELATTEKETESLLTKAVEQMDERINELQKAGVQKFQKYKGNMKYKVVIIDELTVINSKESQRCIDDLVHLGRAAGISLILATQRPSAKVWDSFTDTRSMLGGRLCFYVSDSTDSQIVLGKGNSKGAELPMIPGRAIYNNDRDQLLQAYYLDTEKAVKMLEHLPKKGAQYEQQTIRIPKG